MLHETAHRVARLRERPRADLRAVAYQRWLRAAADDVCPSTPTAFTAAAAAAAVSGQPGHGIAPQNLRPPGAPA